MFLTAMLLTLQSVDEPVARADYLNVMDAEFAAMDADGNGWVTAQEVSAKLTRDEQVQAMAQNRQLFAQLDSNRDGMISPDEFAQLVTRSQPVSPANYMQRIDLNQDGQVTLIEHRKVMLDTFDRLDTDLDGIVTPMEMQAGTAPAPANPPAPGR